MGVLFDYFIAPNDSAAAAVIDQVGGPSAAPVSKPSRFGGLLGRRPKDDGVHQTEVLRTGVDPVVQGGTLEELLTGRPYAEIASDPRSGNALAVRDGGERLVLTLTEGLTEALAAADDDRLAEVAVPWSETEEFWGLATPDELAHILRDLAALARSARSKGHSVYCWVCV